MDKGRDMLHRFACCVGEGETTYVTSSSKDAEARASVRLDLPSLRSLLPYEAMDDEALFINKQSLGFGLHVVPVSHADETLVKALAELIKNRLPVDVDCTVMLYKHAYVEQALQTGFEPMLGQGGIYKKLAEMSLKYHKQAVQDGYPNGCNIGAYLSDYSLYFFYSMRMGRDAHARMQELRQQVESELHVAGLRHRRIEQHDFLALMRTLISPSLHELSWPVVESTPGFPMSHAIPSGNSMFTLGDLNLDVDMSDAEGVPHQTRVVNAHIEKFPESMMLWDTPDLFAHMLHPEHGLPCSFLISFTVRGVNQDKMMAKAKQRAKSLNNNANGVQHFLNPGMRDEGEAWNFIHEQGRRENLALLPTFYNLVLFTTPEKEREVVAKAIGAYRHMGFELQQSRATQWIQFLASMPFFITEGFFNDLNMLGLIRHMTHYSIANLMPVVADGKGSPQGMLLPTHRHQMAFLDTFDNQNLPITNFNFLTVGSSGAGKSMFQQAQILSGLSLGEITYVIDLGHSYKHLCELAGGEYLDVANMALNPFTLFNFDGKTVCDDKGVNEVSDNIQIRDLLALMASPHVPVCDIQKAYLLDAARSCWHKKGRTACMDDVLDTLRERFCVGDSKGDGRLNDLIILLKKYGRDGIYGHLFCGETPFIRNSKFVVFEMSGLQSNPELLTIVMFVMIVVIQGQFYQSDRRLKKRCIIDEAWRFLTEGSNPIAANFIEQGFRTARKYNGGFGVITQYLSDTEETIQGQAIAASSDIKIIMRQGNFKDYVAAHPKRFNAYQQQMIASFGDVLGSGFSNVMIEAGNTYSFHRYFADAFSRVLFSSSGDEFGAVEALCASGMTLDEAVLQVTENTYGEV
jgi:conjugal transfer ATP-binding protein TraC